MRNLKMALMVFMVAGLAVGVAGCGSDDDPVAVPSDSLILDDGTAAEFSLQALSVISEMVAEVPDIASADFGSWSQNKSGLAKTNSDSVTWDDAQEAWVFAYAGPLFAAEAPNYWNISLELWVQYRNQEGPMQYPLGATEMEVHYGTGMEMHMVEGADVSDLAYEMNTAMTVSYLDGAAAYGVVGNGNTVMEVSQVSAQQSQAGSFAMDWNLDVTVSDQGCPSGTATINTQQYRLVAEYDGQGHVDWTMTGPNYQASGTEALGCAQTAY